MGGQDNGLTLEGLAQRLDALERENVELRNEVASLRGSDAARDQNNEYELGGRVSRRTLLSTAGVAAAATLAAGTLFNPRQAEAETFERVFTKQVTAINDSSQEPATIIAQQNESGYGVFGRSVRGTGIRGEGSATTDDAAGVRGLGKTGMWGSSSATGFSGVYGQHTGSVGYGVVGDGKGPGGAGVLGRNGAGHGVRGESVSGYGGQFSGGKAQVRIVPKTTAGRPATGSHVKGEIFMDARATLWVCAASGTPGTWRRVTTTA